MFLKNGCSALKFNNLDLGDTRNHKLLLHGCGEIGNKMPRGFSEILIQAFEAYTFWHSIHVNNDKNFYLLEENYASNLFEVGIVHLVNNELAKLFNSQAGDFSLANLWLSLSHDLKVDGCLITTQEEIDFITLQFEENSSETSEREEYLKLALRFRNKQIAHNSNSDQVMWESYLQTFKFVFRVFAILEKKIEPQVIPRPLIVKKHLFDALKPYYGLKSFSEINKKSEIIRNEVIESCSINLVSNEKGSLRPFASYSI